MIASGIYNKGINPLVTATNNSIAKWSKWSWNINDPSTKKPTIGHTDINVYCLENCINDSVKIATCGLMNQICGKSESIRLVVLTPECSDNVTINRKDSYLYSYIVQSSIHTNCIQDNHEISILDSDPMLYSLSFTLDDNCN